MPNQARVGDITNSGGSHIVWPPTSLNSCAGSVFVNGLNAANIGSVYATHCLGPSCHAPVQATGSGTVIIEGTGAARIGDETDCNHVIGTSSNNVFSGG